MANLTILRTYASRKPADLPLSVLFSHTEKTLTIFDAYPKSTFHFLVLPRILSRSTPGKPGDKASDPQGTPQTPQAILSLSATDLSSLRTLLNSKNVSKDQAKEVILSLKEDALRVKTEIEKEMEKRYGFVWDVWIGFHGAPSMEHIHLHVISADLCSERMKTKKHYNSFHPRHGFFLHVDKVLSWFDAGIPYFQSMSKLLPTEYEPLLKEPLTCFHCNAGQKNMPTLKAHLQGEREKLSKRHEMRKRRQSESSLAQKSQCEVLNEEATGPASKKLKVDKS